MNNQEIIEKLFSDNSDEVINTLIYINENELNDRNILKEVLKLFKLTENNMEKELIIDYFKKISDEWLDKELIKLFSSTNPFLRNAAMEILRNKKGNVIDSLFESMNNEDKDVRKLVVDTAYKINDSKKIEILKKGLKDNDINVVITTIEYIGELELTEFKESVFELFKNSDNPFLKVVCLETLSIIGDKDILLKLKEIIKITDISNKLLLFPFLKIIGNFGESEDLNYLADALENLDKTYLKEITNAMEHIVINKGIKELDKNIYYKLESLIFKDINSINKYGLITFLANFENDSLKDTLRKSMKIDDRLLILGCLEIIGQKGYENEFKEELLNIKDKFKDDEEIKEILDDLIFLTGE